MNFDGQSLKSKTSKHFYIFTLFKWPFWWYFCRLFNVISLFFSCFIAFYQWSWCNLLSSLDGKLYTNDDVESAFEKAWAWPWTSKINKSVTTNLQSHWKEKFYRDSHAQQSYLWLSTTAIKKMSDYGVLRFWRFSWAHLKYLLIIKCKLYTMPMMNDLSRLVKKNNVSEKLMKVINLL